MKKEYIEELLKDDYLNEKIQFIDTLIKDEKFNEAYIKYAAILEFINVKFILNRFNIKLDDSDIIEIIKIYAEKDKYLFEHMKSINGDYNLINLESVDLSDIEGLAISINDIYKYMVEKYGTFLN